MKIARKIRRKFLAFAAGNICKYLGKNGSGALGRV
jgi:hypothetical protein